MRLLTSTLVAGLFAVTLGGAAVIPAAAQDASAKARPGEQRQELMLRQHPGKGGMMRHHRGARGGPQGHGGLLMLACSEQGADRLEHMLLSLSQRVDPTAEQQPLFEDFRTAALTAQTSFADRCVELRPQDGTADVPDLMARLETGIAIGEARLAAMNEVLPALDAFYGSLTDAQKALLEPRRGMRDGRRGMRAAPPMPTTGPEAPAAED